MRAWETQPEDWVAHNASAIAVARGNGFVVLPRRAIGSWLDTAGSEQHDLWALTIQMRDRLVAERGTEPIQVLFTEDSASDSLEICIRPNASDGEPLAVDTSDGDRAQDLPAGTTTRLIDARDDRTMQQELTSCLDDRDLDRVDLLVSFVMKSGLALIGEQLERAIQHGARVRVLTTDYLRITDADALALLLDLVESAEDFPGSLEVKIFSDPLTSFHPKAYLFHSSNSARAIGFVGSSNLSASGIDTGIEWNLSTSDVAPLITAFDALWDDKRSWRLDHDMLRSYRELWRPTAGEVVGVGAVQTEPPATAPEPRPLQAEALAALTATRARGFRAGMVVMATGLGKTWLAAFDSAAVCDSIEVDPTVDGGSRRPGRTLFVAHREEILRQSRDVFRAVRPEAELGLFHGPEKQPDADVVFASVQTLARRLDEFAPDEFDYIVIDEFHHAAAKSYRKVIDHFEPQFLLGLTATPERMDGADLFSLCGDNLVFECGLVEGIDRSELVPFRYWGIRDVVDYEAIPWRNGRFDPEILAERIETVQRAQQAFDEWQDKCGERTLAFCASIGHATFMEQFFAERGVACAAVHSEPGSADRRRALDDLRNGSLQVLFAVDMFNEGVDVPEIDSVLMLRPTDSPVVFLQQLGRGLRLSDGKDHLRVVDFVGNHRSFLLHPRTLLGMGRVDGQDPSTVEVITAVERGEFDLPAGCSIVFDLDAIDLLRQLAQRSMSVGDLLDQFVLDYTAEHETRPSAAQAAAAGHDLSVARTRSGGWFSHLATLGVLEPIEISVVESVGTVLRAVEAEPIRRSYKLVTLRALLRTGALRTGMSVNELAAASQALIAADPRLVNDARSESLREPADAAPEVWERFWREMPLDHLVKGDSPLFRYDGDRFVPTFAVPVEIGDAFDAMVAELVEWRLGEYLLRAGSVSAESDDSEATVARCEVANVGGLPIVRLAREINSDLPYGEVRFTADGTEYVGRLGKRNLKEAWTPGDESTNRLPELLRGWFGPDAGLAGTRHAVTLTESAVGWVLASEDARRGLAQLVGQRFTRQQIRELFDATTIGNWQAGHIPLPSRHAIVLLVTLDKAGMSSGTEYHDYFEATDTFVWTSQNSTSPTSKRGLAILNAESDGTSIHLFVRSTKGDPFEYMGTVLPISHEGSEPMTVRFRLAHPAAHRTVDLPR